MAKNTIPEEVQGAPLYEPEALDGLYPPDKVLRRRYWLRWIFGGVLLLLFVLLSIAYWQRVKIAERFVQQQIENYGVRANYKIRDIGLRTQRIENLVIGDPANPDIKAESIEIDVAINFSGVTLRDVRAKNVRLNGRFADGKLSFGELDKFSDTDSEEPFVIPDIGVELSNAVVRLETPWGVIGAGLDGEGLLRQRFEGNLALRAPKLQYQDCRADNVGFDGRYKLDFRQPNLIGPWTAAKVDCAGVGLAAARPVIDGEMRLNERFDRWLGNVKYSARSVTMPDLSLLAPRGSLTFDGQKARTNFDLELDGGGYESKQLNIRALAMAADGHIDFSGPAMSVTARGDADIKGGKLNPSYISPVDAIAASSRATPVGPLLDRLAPAVRRAAANFDARLRYDANISAGGSVDGRSLLLLDGADIAAQSGARVRQSGVAQINNNGNGWRLASPLRLSMSGGNLPALDLALKQNAGGSISGDLSLDRYAAGNSSLAVSKLAFSGIPGGSWSFNGRAELSGPIPQGFLRGVNFPIDGRYNGAGFVMYNSCQTIGVDSLTYAGLSLQRQNVRICPDGGNIIETGGKIRIRGSIPSLAINGSYSGSRISAKGSNVRFDLANGFVANAVAAEYGSNPIRIATPIVRFSFAKGFDAENVHVETGAADSLTYFDIAAINGTFAPNGLRGALSGGGGKIANVPVIISDTNGEWTLVDGDLALDSSLVINDAEQVDRFKTLNIPDMLLTFEDGVINALGNMYEPNSGVKIAGVDIRHQLNSGEGRALLAVDDLVFGDKLQPEMITPLTLGVIQNVNGSVYGDAAISWDTRRDGIISTGRFGTQGLDLAAAFGPVRGLKTEMLFTDLLSLETAATQIARIDTINPGVAALDGLIRYRLLAGRKVQIEGGSWPFAGGELMIQPTIWDMSSEAPRNLVLEVKGVEVAKFLEQFDFGNVSATGIFDGRLPMVFDAKGGRIVGGELIARSGGGNISYIGELTYKDMNAYANFAFDALRSIDYTGLRVGMDGDLGGEIITNINFEGVKQGTGAKRNFITNQLASIPVKFNIRIEASFFELMGIIRSTYDSDYLVQRYRAEIEAQIKAAKEASQEAATPKAPDKP